MKIFATTDTHFGHDAMVWMGAGRPADYAEKILNSIRKNSGDLLIHTGDFCFGEDDKWAREYIRAAAGFKRKILVRGNHDKKSDSWYLERGFDMVCEAMLCKYFGKQILFSHMPARREQGSNSYWTPHFPPDFNFHGHLHGDNHRRINNDPEIYDRNYYYDLAPDVHNYEIINIQKICQEKSAENAASKKATDTQ